MSRLPAVLLVSPGILRWTDQDFGLPHLVSIGGYLERELAVRVEILDLGYEGGDHASLARTIASLGPFVLIGLSCYSSFDYRRVLSVARFLKALDPSVPLVGGGYHASALPGDLVFPGSPFDAVVVGEGERPIAEMLRSLLGGGRIERQIYGSDLVMELDTLPPYRWDLLRRYWPRAHDLGRKFQIYLSRGCPYHCAFCMERAKSGYRWRAYSSERALDELRRLARVTDLGRWVVNVADPLFGFNRRWRREVLEGVIREGLLPRQYWTLTRSDDLDDTDVSLLARARFSIGIGLESGSPRMLKIMQKGNEPVAYLDAMLGLAERSRKHGLSWAANVIVGHPGETPESLRETRAFLERLYLAAPDTCGWLSIDPFRLYPGADIHVDLRGYEARHGARFFHPAWWKRWYDGPFYAQHLDPGTELDFEARVRFMYDAYGPFVTEVQRRFRGQGRSVDRVFERSLDEQREGLSERARDRMIAAGRRALAALEGSDGTTGGGAPELALSRPLGLQIRNPWVRRREEAVRRLLEAGVLRTERVVEALLEVAPERWIPFDDAEAVLQDRPRPPAVEGALSWSPSLTVLGMGLEALGLGLGDRVAILGVRGGYVAAVMQELVGESGEAAELPAIRDLAGVYEAVWFGAALPRAPRWLRERLRRGGRAVVALGPRFRAQDLVVLTRELETESADTSAIHPLIHTPPELAVRTLARVTLPVFGGPGGWVPAPPPAAEFPALSFERWPAPALAFRVFAHVDLGEDAASLYDPKLPVRPWAEGLAAAWRAAPGRLALVALAMRDRTVDALVAALRSDVPTALADPAGRALITLFSTALLDLHPVEGGVVPSASPPHASLPKDLAHLRALLWEAQPTPPPPIVVLDCPALGTRGRAVAWAGLRRVAVSFDTSVEHVLMQVLHEEMHVLTDPHVLAGRSLDARDTRAGSDGHALHLELEEVAIAATDALIRAKAPGWHGAFTQWCAGLAGG